MWLTLAIACGGPETPPPPLTPSPLPARAVEVAQGRAEPGISVSLAKDTRPALVGPGEWTFQVGRDTPARFRSAVGIPKAGRVCFTLVVDTTSSEKCLEQPSEWQDFSLDLPVAPAPSTITLRSTGGAWADPTVIPLRADPRPDVVLLILDTTRWDHFNSAGYAARSTTPVLDEWMRGATVFTQARSPAPWTAPAIASALTGLLPTEHGTGLRIVREPAPDETNDARKLLDYAPLRPSIETVTTTLRRAGYDTVALSANGFFSPHLGLDQGFGRFAEYSAKDWAAARTGVARAVRTLKGRSKQAPPLFLTVHFVDPHHPYTLRKPAGVDYPLPTDLDLEKKGTGTKQMISLLSLDAKARAHPLQTQVLYDAEVRWMDGALADLLAVVPKDALVIGFADHGEAFGEHGSFVHGNTLYDELLRVPLFVRWPDGTPGPVDTPVSTSAIAATILDAAALPHPGFEPLPRQAGEAHAILSEAMYAGPDQTSLIADGWKYIFSHPRSLGRPEGTALGKEELYRLTDDPAERTNLAESEPERLAPLRARVRQHLSTRWPGVHIRCQGPAKLDVRGEGLRRVDVLVTERGDQLRLQDEALTGEVGEGVRELVLQTLGPTRLSFAGDAFPASTAQTGSLPNAPSEPTPGTCVLWEVQPAARAASIDPETAEELEQLGYVGG